jgi:hypothetical protein
VRSKVLVALAVTVALVLASGTAAVAKPLSKQEWRTRVTTICTDANDQVTAAAIDAFKGLRKNHQPSLKRLTKFTNTVVPLIEKAVADVDALDEPASFTNGVKKWLAAIKHVVDRFRADPKVVNEADPFGAANKLAKKLGLHGCV